MKLLNTIVLTCGLLLLQGCGLSWFANPKDQPIIEDKLGSKIGTLATTAERRVVIFDRNTGSFCAEPPADAADNLASSFVSTLKGGNGNIEGQAEIAKMFASTAKQLFLRSQGIQLYRDGMYSLCQSFINKAVTASEFNKIQAELLKESSKLIQQEIPYLQNLKVDDIQSPTVPTITSPKQ